jgi:hypothetical protein
MSGNPQIGNPQIGNPQIGNPPKTFETYLIISFARKQKQYSFETLFFSDLKKNCQLITNTVHIEF